jgi:hypothetical protein
MPRPKRSGASPLEHHPLGNALHDGTVLLISVWCLRHSGISSLGVLGTARPGVHKGIADLRLVAACYGRSLGAIAR